MQQKLTPHVPKLQAEEKLQEARYQGRSYACAVADATVRRCNFC